MKVDDTSRADPAQQPPGEAFKKVLAQQAQLPKIAPRQRQRAAGIATLNGLSAAVTTTQRARATKMNATLDSAREGNASNNARLSHERCQARSDSGHGSDDRSRIRAELDKGSACAEAPTPAVAEVRATSSAPPSEPGGSSPTVHAATPAAAAIELVERIERLTQSDRPGLALSLQGALNAEVTVEKIATGTVSVRIQPRGKTIAAEDLSRIKNELSGRGLKLARLIVDSPRAG